MPTRNDTAAYADLPAYVSDILYLDKPDLIISVGSKPAAISNKFPAKTNIIFTLISDTTYKIIKKQNPGSHSSAVYINQPWSRQFDALKSTIPSIKKLSILYTKKTSHLTF